ncbi:MAG: hypothetical protein AAFR87_02835 [Bacteroidota bacterium]
MNKILVSILTGLLLSSNVSKLHAQNEEFSNSVAYAEVGVVGLFGFLAGLNLSYEHRLFSNPDNNLHIYGRGGVAASGVLFGSGGLGGLVGGSLLTGSGNHHFEVDLGVIVGKNDGSGSNDVFVQGVGEVGYRFQKPGGGFLFKLKAGITGIGGALGYAF